LAERRCQGTEDLRRRYRRPRRSRRIARPRWPKLAQADLTMIVQNQRKIVAVADPAELAKAAADRLMARIAANDGRVAICLTGGCSPKQLHALLATEAL